MHGGKEGSADKHSKGGLMTKIQTRRGDMQKCVQVMAQDKSWHQEGTVGTGRTEVERERAKRSKTGRTVHALKLSICSERARSQEGSEANRHSWCS